MSTEEYLQIDRTRIHALMGPIRVEGGESCEVLENNVPATRHGEWAGAVLSKT